MNPEFRRNLWIELTRTRLLVGLGIPAVVLAAVWLRPDASLAFRHNASILLFDAIAVIWGTRRAANTIGGEVRGRTWEAQAMSALSAWSLTWGKLFGGCSLVWLAALVCLASTFAVDAQLFSWQVALGNAGLRLCTAFAAQAVAMCSALIFLRKTAPGKSLNSTLSQGVGIIAWAIFGTFFAPTTTHYDWVFVVAEFGLGGEIQIDWYGIDARDHLFRLLSLAAFVGWTWLAANRLMRRVLQYSSLPWAWSAFVLFMVGYVGGFFTGGGAANWLAAGFMAAAWLTFPAVLSDVKDAVGYRWLVDDVRAGRWHAALLRVPAWMPGLAIAAVLGVAVAATAPFSIGEALGAEDFLGFIETIRNGQWFSTSWMLALALFAIRDLGIIHIFAFSDAGRYSDVVAVLVLMALYLVVPIAGTAIDSQTLVAAFVPLDLGNAAQTLLPIGVEAVAAVIGAVAMARRALRPASAAGARAAHAV